MSANQLMFSFIQGGFAKPPMFQIAEPNVFNLSGAKFVARVEPGISSLHSFRYSNDGMKVYMTDGTKLYQYSLSTPFRISSMAAVADGEYTWDTSVVQEPASFEFSDDGSVIIGMGVSYARLSRWNLTVPWDITGGVTYINSSTSTSTEALLAMRKDGTQYVSFDTATNTLRARNFGTPFDPSTRSGVLSTADVSSFVSQSGFGALTFARGGTDLYLPSNLVDEWFVHLRLGLAHSLVDFDIVEAAPFKDYIANQDPSGGNEIPYCVEFDPSGEVITTLTRNGSISYLREWNVAELPVLDGYLLENAVYSSINAGTTNGNGLDIEVTSQFLFLTNSGSLQRYELLTPGDAESLDLTTNVIASFPNVPVGHDNNSIVVSSDGTTVLGISTDDGLITQYELTSAFDPSSIRSTGLSESYSVGNTTKGLSLGFDSSSLIFGDLGSNTLKLVSLASAYNPAGGAVVETLELGTTILGLTSRVKLFGDALLVSDADGVIHKYLITVPGSIESAVYTGIEFDFAYECALGGTEPTSSLGGFFFNTPSSFVAMEGTRVRVWRTDTIPQQWTPAELFAGGEDGFWYDFSDEATLFTDPAGTAQVAQYDDPIRAVHDKSGNGYDLELTSDALVPPSWSGEEARFLASGSHFRAATGTSLSWMHDGTSFSVALGVSPGLNTNPDTLHTVLSTIPSLGTSSIGYATYYDDRSSVPRNNGLVNFIGAGIGGSPVISALHTDVWQPAVRSAVSINFDPDNGTSASREKTYMNGTELSGTNTGSAPPAGATTVTLHVGRDGGGSWPFAGTMKHVISINRPLSLSEAARLEKYLRA